MGPGRRCGLTRVKGGTGKGEGVSNSESPESPENSESSENPENSEDSESSEC